MKRIIFFFACLFWLCSSSNAQVQIGGPLANINGTVEGQEFIIFHTNSLSGSDSTLRATLGHFDVDNANLVEDESKHLDTFKTYDEKLLNVLSLDYDGDGFDEIVMAHQEKYRTATWVRLNFPVVSESNLNLSANNQNQSGLFAWPNGTNAPDRDPNIKLDKADINGDRKDEIVAMFRNANGDFILQLLTVDMSSSQAYSIIVEQQIRQFFPDGNSAYEAFDLAVGDFDGDGKDDIAVAAIEEIAGLRSIYLKLYSVTPTNSFSGWTITEEVLASVVAIPANANWENIALAAGNFDLGNPNRDMLALAFAYNDNSGGTPTMKHRLQMIEVNGPVGNELSAVVIGGIYNVADVQNGNRPAVALTAGDMNNDQVDEFVVAFDASFQVFAYNSPNLIPGAQGSGGQVPTNFYQLVDANNYIAIGDVDWDLQKDLLIVTTNDDGNANTPEHYLRAQVFGINNSLDTFSLKDSKDLQTKAYAGSANDYHYAATFGAFRGGRFNLLPPHQFQKQIFRPLVVNNSPPYHFDIIGNDTIDLFDCYA
ncbi:MAG: hypothetical protein AAFQ68_27085, partial [Bacteroidota bacterium]